MRLVGIRFSGNAAHVRVDPLTLHVVGSYNVPEYDEKSPVLHAAGGRL